MIFYFLVAVVVLSVACAKPKEQLTTASTQNDGAALQTNRSASLGPSSKTAATWELVWELPQKELQVDFIFQDASGLWRCHEMNCAQIWTDTAAAATSFELPCIANLWELQVSRSGRWLAKLCRSSESRKGVLHVLDIETRSWKHIELTEAANVWAAAVDDSGLVTLSANWGEIVRLDTDGRVRTFQVARPKEADTILPANPPWLAYSDGAYTSEVAYHQAAPTQPIAMRGGAFANGPHLWVSFMTGGYGRLTPSGAERVEGGQDIRGARLPHGSLMGIHPWGTDGLLIEYESTLLFVDSELRTVHETPLPNVKGLARLGSNPQGSVIHSTGPFGVGYVYRIPKL